MTIDDLVSRYPILYHMAARGSWQSIQQHGLLSTSALLDLYQIQGEERKEIEARHRPQTIALTNPAYGTAFIRDQKPMSDSGLRRALQDGIMPEEWYRILNRKVFFWTNTKRLHTFLSARAYRDEEHDVLWVDTKTVAKQFVRRIYISPINSGTTMPMAHPRGAKTFLALEQYPFENWVRKRGVREAVVEVAFEGGIPELSPHVIKVVRMKKATIVNVIYSRS